MPLALAGFEINANQTLAKQVVSRAVPAVKIASGRLHGQIHQSELLIHSDLRPHAGVARVFRGAFLPSVVAKLTFLRDGMENPEALAGSHVETAHVTFVVAHALRSHAFAESRADDDGLSCHDGR